jgi:hypothetical protein
MTMSQAHPKLHHVVQSLYIAAFEAVVSAFVADLLVSQTAASVLEPAAAAVAETGTLTIQFQMLRPNSLIYAGLLEWQVNNAYISNGMAKIVPLFN